MPDLSPPFPLPGRGDRVLVRVYGPGPAPGPGPAGRWCRVVSVETGRDVLFPVAVLLPDGRRGCYQQQEILGWRPSRLRLILSRARA